MALGSNFTVADFLEVYGGEVIKSYNQNILVSDKLRSRTIQNGKSANFPVFGREEAKLHTVGDDLFGASPDFASDVTTTNETITIDKLLIAPQFVADMDEAMAHYDIRGELAIQAGAALATAQERWSIAALGKGAVDNSHSVSVTGAFASVTGANLASGIVDAAKYMDNLFVPSNDRYVILPPNEFYKLMQEDGVVSSDFGRGGDRAAGGAGTLFYMGFEILNSSVMNEFDDTTAAEQKASGGPLYFGGTTQRTDLSSDLQLCLGIAFQKEAAGVAVLKGMTTELDWVPERQGHLLVAKQAIGVDMLQTSGVCNLISAS